MNIALPDNQLAEVIGPHIRESIDKLQLEQVSTDTYNVLYKGNNGLLIEIDLVSPITYDMRINKFLYQNLRKEEINDLIKKFYE